MQSRPRQGIIYHPTVLPDGTIADEQAVPLAVLREIVEWKMGGGQLCVM